MLNFDCKCETFTDAAIQKLYLKKKQCLLKVDGLLENADKIGNLMEFSIALPLERRKNTHRTTIAYDLSCNSFMKKCKKKMLHHINTVTVRNDKININIYI